MKYPHLKPEIVKEYKISALDGGINRYNSPELILDNQLSESRNMWYKNGTLRSRMGVSCIDGSVISDDLYANILRPLEFTKSYFTVDGNNCRIAYLLTGDGYTYEFLKIFFVSEDGTFTSAGSIHFHRVDSTAFYRLENVFFMSGKKTSGCGIYAYITQKSGNQRLYDIYELDSTGQNWYTVNSSNYYIPVVLLGGRGESYHEAEEMAGFSAAEPSAAESFNLLSGGFRAYYTSDGYSAVFYLPVSGLTSDSTVKCRVYFSQSYYYEWTILPNKDSAVTLTESGNVTMYCQRATGCVQFKLSNSEMYSVPSSYIVGSNNMYFEATRSTPDNKEAIISSKNCCLYNGDAFFYGNMVSPATVYQCSYEKPLYFPEGMKTSVGNSEDLITAMGVQNNKLIAFKSGECYRISVSSNDSKAISETPIGKTDNIFIKSQLTVTPVNLQVGCMDYRTLCPCGNRLIWLGSDKKVYTLATTTYGKENNIYELSLPIEESLIRLSNNDIKKAFGLDIGGYYFLGVGNKAFILDYRVRNFGISSVYSGLKDDAKSISWYEWTFPQSSHLCDGFYTANDVFLALSDQNDIINYMCTLSGETDTVFEISANITQKKEYTFESYFSTALLDFGKPHIRKRIGEVFFDIFSNGRLNVTLTGDSVSDNHTLRLCSPNLSVVRFMASLYGVERVKAKISSNSSFGISSIIFRYNEISSIR